MMKRPIGGHTQGEVVPALDCPPHDGTLMEMKCPEQILMLGEIHHLVLVFQNSCHSLMYVTNDKAVAMHCTL